MYLSMYLIAPNHISPGKQDVFCIPSAKYISCLIADPQYLYGIHDYMY